MKKSRVLAVGAAGVVAAAGALVVRSRRWKAAGDPEGDDFATFPAGTEATIVTSDGGRLAAFAAGPDDGQPVVLAHGWTNSAKVWSKVAKRLVADGYRVIAYDQRGHGGSTPGREQFTVNRLGADLAEVLAHFDVQEAVVAGHSMGGMTIMALINDDPTVLKERAIGVVLVSTSAVQALKIRGIEPIAAKILGSEMLAARMGPRFTRGAFGSKPVYGHVQSTAEMWRATDRQAIGDAFVAMMKMDLRPGLAGCPVPASVIVGTRDTLTPLKSGQQIAGAIPGARLTVVDGAGHMLPFERPAVVVQVIEAVAKAR